MMLNIGCYLSATRDIERWEKKRLKLEQMYFNFYTNPRGGKAKEVVPDKSLLQIAEENEFVAMIAHAPYTLNFVLLIRG